MGISKPTHPPQQLSCCYGGQATNNKQPTTALEERYKESMQKDSETQQLTTNNQQPRSKSALAEKLYSFDESYRIVSPLAGIDEAGRGPLAGPVVAAAVILPEGILIEGLNDSKRLTPRRRETLAARLRESGAAVGIGMATPAEIDHINILQATMTAMQRAMQQLSPAPAIVLIDGNKIPYFAGIEARCIVGGDGKSASIAAASIAAKVYRDEIMRRYDEVYPGYGFAAHKGYGTAEHIQALMELGPCPIHRRSFAPVSSIEKDGKNAVGPGTLAEQAACEFLEKRGYSIKERNYRLKTGEIDIIAVKDGLLIFTEVKMRSGTDGSQPCEAVTPRQQARIIRTAEAYAAWKAGSALCRFDIIEVVPAGSGYTIERHIENAFQKP